MSPRALTIAIGLVACAVSRPVDASLVLPSVTVLSSPATATPEHRALADLQTGNDDERMLWTDMPAMTLASETDESFFSPSGPSSPMAPAPAGRSGSPKGSAGIGRGRLLLWSGFSVAAGVEAFRRSQAAWGMSKGKFHFKSDFKGDGLAMTDEASHLLVAYRLSRVIEGGYRWTGMTPESARLYGSAEAWLLTFLVEYPIDAYNPQQGFGISDLVFNSLGVAAAWIHSSAVAPRWDFKVSVKNHFFKGSGRIVAYNTTQYDDFVYWVTYRLARSRFVPLLLGAGYSTTHQTSHDPIKELRLGVGTSLEEIGALIGPKTEQFLRPLNFFFFNFSAKISWR